jgi:hypothetical protein
VFYDENGAYQNLEARSHAGRFATADDVIAECQRMVDADLDEVREPGMSGSAVLIRWQMWGRDPFIRADEGEQAPEWSAWKYAATRTKTL